MESFSNDVREDVMRFVTGTTKVPLDGFDPAFTITKAEGADENTLPTSHTCFNQLVLPEYQTEEKLIDKYLKSGELIKTIYVKDRLINYIIK